MTSKEFTVWKEYLLQEPNDFNPDHYYYAAIIAEIAKGHVKQPQKVKIKDRILNFGFKKGAKAESARNDLDDVDSNADKLDQKVSMSKAAWLTATGWFKRNKNANT